MTAAGGVGQQQRHRAAGYYADHAAAHYVPSGMGRIVTVAIHLMYCCV